MFDGSLPDLEETASPPPIASAEGKSASPDVQQAADLPEAKTLFWLRPIKPASQEGHAAHDQDDNLDGRVQEHASAEPPEPQAVVGAAPAPVWKEEPPKRSLGRQAKIFGGLALGAIAFVAASGLVRSSTKKEEPQAPPLETVTAAADLRNRRDSSPHDFRPKQGPRPFLVIPQAQGAAVSSEQQPAPQVAPFVSPSEMAARIVRRANDPDDLIAHRGTGQEEGGRLPNPAHPHIPVRFVDVAGDSSPAPGAPSSETNTQAEVIAKAGALVPASLENPLEMSGGAVTCIARAEGGGFPAGTKLVGQAQADSEGTVSLRFTKAILPNGLKARVLGEAQDGDGGFGIRGMVQGQEEEPSPAKDAAKDTAADVAIDALGLGVAGHAARNYAWRSSARRYGGAGSKVKVVLGAGTKFRVFLHEPATIE